MTYTLNDLIAAGLFGALGGVFLLLAATGMLLALREWREATREGTPLVGEEFERAKRKEKS